MGNILLVALALAGLALPGFTWWQVWTKRDSAWENLSKGICFGFGVAVLGVYLLAFISLKVVVYAWILLMLGSVAYWFSKRAGLKEVFSVDQEHTKWLLGILAVTAALRFLPTFFEPYPRGWDPYAHLLLIQEMLTKDGHVFNWMPYESIPLRYPTGSHLLVALVTKMTGVAPHLVFNIVLVWVSLLTCLQLYALTKEVSGNRDLALFSMAVYGLLAIAGSVGYYAWGGLPNLLGVYLMLGAVSVFFSWMPDNKLPLLLSLFFISICLVHEHALLVAIAVFAGFGVRCLMTKERERTMALLKAAVPSMIIGGLYHYFHDPRGYSMVETGFFKYREELHTPSFILNSVGPPFVIFAMLGFWIFRKRQQQFALDPFFLWMTGVMLVCFGLFEYGARLITPILYGESFAPATPARFLTDAVVPLSVFGGIFLMSLQDMLGCGRRVLMAVILVFAGFNHWLYASYMQPVVQPAALEAYAWVQQNTPPDTQVLADKVEAAYFCRRPASNAALPSSELWAHTANRNLLYDTGVEILSGKVPQKEIKVPLVMISEAGMARTVFSRMETVQPGLLQPVWQSQDESYVVFVVRLNRPVKK
ncbi:MAG: hypothetical protein K0Q55_3064 [Verrucomicrobia bacterium]|jgi:hypothetical protein|nr:hypothetical protein [Verrucomicrobiota bacterium]